ncbi:MAG: aminoacyl-histidine dipeptidase [Coxiella sp. DG_40]|nr:MAG: aminoacyl-histidine dipeptidase [Coxiella sp. DG_40]
MSTEELSNLQPQSLWKHFTQICQVPHPSKKEEKIVKFIQQFGQNLGLETIIDKVGNVLIRKPATPGMENHKGVILQGHLDMVPQKANHSKHDFEEDPIQAYIDGEWVKAKETTLGADNGIGIAAIMAVLESKDISHGPIEALFTIDEEVGMTGSSAFKPGILQGDILLNLDSEEDGVLFIGCAGGVFTDVKLNYTEMPMPANTAAFKIDVSGLKGGHSGAEINLGRGNANKIINRLLWQASKNYQIGLAKISGGNMHNSIPRDAIAIVTLPNEKKNDFVKFVNKFTETIKLEHGNADPDIKIDMDTTTLPNSMIEGQIQRKLLNAIYGCPNGVLRMSADVPNFVETSTNLARIHLENGTLEISNFPRSSVESLIRDTANMIASIFELIGAKTSNSSEFPSWQPDPNSYILDLMKKVYQNKFGKEAEIKVLHAGLECSLLKHLYPNLDMISFGPAIIYAHSPDEKVNIKSVSDFWDLLIETLKNV